MLKNLSLPKLAIAITIILITTHTPHGQNSTPQLGKNSLKEVIAAMTTEEKADVLVGMGFGLEIPGLPRPSDIDKRTPEIVVGAAGRTHAISRLGIPSLVLSDGPAGVRISPIRNGDKTKSYYATGFPIATLVASSWNTEVAEHIGAAIGREARDYGIDIMLAPAMNIHRNPLGGRNFEYYSEDPLIAGKMAASFVKGVQSNGVGTSIKHFAVNNQEFNRMQSNSILSERALREIYLRGFEIAVKEAQPWTVMSSYNLINGTPASHSQDLLTTILRNEWGFKGFVMTDWYGGSDPVAQLKAGNDVLMPGYLEQINAIVKAVADGTVDKQLLDRNVERVLEIVLQSPAFKRNKHSDQPDLNLSAQIGREAATEGMILLKNDNNALPLTAAAKVALLGNSSYELIAGGTGSGDVNKKYIVSLDQGLASAGFSVDDSLKTAYGKFIADQKAKRPKTPAFMLPPPIPEMSLESDRLQQLANEANVAVITLGRNSGEFADRNVEKDFNLADSERAFIENVSNAFHAKNKKVVVVLNVGGPVEIASWRAMVDAVLLAWQPGQDGGYAIADVLSGKVNPSGKLATTFPLSYADVPSAKTFPGRETGQPSQVSNPFAGKPAEAVYEEGIYVGYRYYETFGVKPAYDFGYGLSYTTFKYGTVKLSTNKFQDKVTATVTVLNSGTQPGKEVVQLYVSAPKQKLKKPASELKAFAKTRLLKPGESQTISFTLTGKDLASFDTASSSWVAEAGTYTINIAASPAAIKTSASFQLAKDLVVEKSQRLLAPAPGLKDLLGAQASPPAAAITGASSATRQAGTPALPVTTKVSPVLTRRLRRQPRNFRSRPGENSCSLDIPINNATV
jgi:beta-glucosidase